MKSDLRIARYAVMILAVTVLAASCETMESVTRTVAPAQQVRTSATGVDFRPGEQLASYRDWGEVTTAHYRAAAIRTAPSDATQGQAEVIFTNGDRTWARYVLVTRKPNRNDMFLGRKVLYMSGGISRRGNASADRYRNTSWVFGRVTSTDELFRDRVEVDGDAIDLQWLRVSDDIVE